jgi:hypothetical protein
MIQVSSKLGALASLCAPLLLEGLLQGPRRHIREELAESLHHRRVREDGVAEPRVWQVCQQRRLRHGDDLAGLGAKHREAENAVVTPPNERLHEALLGNENEKCTRSVRKRMLLILQALLGRFGLFPLSHLCQVAK